MRETPVIDKNEIEAQKAVMELVKNGFSGRSPKALVETYGCQQNVNDSQRLKGMLTEMGYSLTEDRDEADLILMNTCAVRDNAEQRVFGNLGALKHLKAKKPELIIGVCGCMPQQEHIADRIRAKYRHVDLIFGTHALYRFPSLLAEALEHRSRVIDIGGEGAIAEGLPVLYDNGAKAFVSIMYGCNNFCSYCIVPYVRGRERSRRAEDVLAEIRALAERGVKEVMLLGQNVNSYGGDRGETDAFAELLYMVNEIPGIERIRFMSSHPKDLSEGLLLAMSRCAKVCHQLHLPLQSGSDKVLRDMNRRYGAEKYLSIVSRARELMPDISLTTDIIVGFPTEERTDFEDTLKILEAVRFDSIFSFIFSPREGTPAAKMESAATNEEKSAWFQEMLDLQNRISAEINAKCVGQVRDVLVEGESRHEPDMLFGRDYANKIVNFRGDISMKDKIVKVRITKAQTWILYGELM